MLKAKGDVLWQKKIGKTNESVCVMLMRVVEERKKEETCTLEKKFRRLKALICDGNGKRKKSCPSSSVSAS